MGNGASEYKQDLQKYLVIGGKKQGELTESERRLRKEMCMIFWFLEIKVHFWYEDLIKKVPVVFRFQGYSSNKAKSKQTNGQS